MRRCAGEGRRQDLLDAAWLLDRAPNPESVTALMAGFEEAFRGRDASALPEELVQALAGRGKASLSLRLRQRDPAALPESLDRLKNPATATSEKVELLRTLVEIRVSGIRNVLLALLRDQPTPVRQAALSGLGLEEDPAMAAVVLQLLPGASPELRSSALNFLVSRPTWSLSLLDAMSRGEVQAQSIPAEVAERLRRSPDATVRQRAVAALAASVPVPNSTTAQRIRQIEAVLKKSPGNPYAGEALFQQRCAACHRLFFKGGSVGPDLTSYQRDHLGTLLTSILDPSAEIREGYASVEVETRDGRTLSGFLTDRDDRQTTLRGLDGQDQVLPAAEVLAVRPTGRSLMPEGLLEGLSDDQLRDFFAFLRSSQPFSR
jgi:putative heme-binding domain-containing protein